MNAVMTMDDLLSSIEPKDYQRVSNYLYAQSRAVQAIGVWNGLQTLLCTIGKELDERISEAELQAMNYSQIHTDTQILDLDLEIAV